MPRRTIEAEVVDDQVDVPSVETEEQAATTSETDTIQAPVTDAYDGPDWQRISSELSRPFAPTHIRVKPGKVGSNGQALALWYIDARAVMDRLDDVVGAGNWEFTWNPIPVDGGRVVIQGVLTVCGVTKSDVGEAKGEDEPWKSGVSDAFKRTAVQFGIGRFLYRLPQTWWPYDEQSRRFAQQDELSELVERVMRDLEEVDGDATQIRMKDYSDILPRDLAGSRGAQRPGSDGSGGNGNGGITPAQENYIRRLYAQKFGRYSNGNVLFGNILKEHIGRVCSVEKLTRTEADTVIKTLQETASAA